MPELPEVESIVRSLKPLVVGRKIVSASFTPMLPSSLLARRLRRMLGNPAQEFCRRLCGVLIQSVERYGKHIVFELRQHTGSGGRYFLQVHLGMTGRLTCEGTPEFKSKHTHLVLALNEPGRWLHYTDIRRFGRLRVTDQITAGDNKLGPDALEISQEQFVSLLRCRRTMLKSLLLNQRFLRGMGNIYADESLFRAGIHPSSVAARLSRKRAIRLYEGIRETLLQAIEQGGSSVSDYVDGQGRAGYFQLLHQVYRRTGKPCLRCGTPIRKIVLASRSTHFCPLCQRGPRAASR